MILRVIFTISPLKFELLKNKKNDYYIMLNFIISLPSTML